MTQVSNDITITQASVTDTNNDSASITSGVSDVASTSTYQEQQSENTDQVHTRSTFAKKMMKVAQYAFTGFGVILSAILSPVSVPVIKTLVLAVHISNLFSGKVQENVDPLLPQNTSFREIVGKGTLYILNAIKDGIVATFFTYY